MKSLPPIGATERDRDTAIDQLIQGRSNATGSVTLAVSTTTTTVSKATISEDASVFLMPVTANGSTAFASAYISDVSHGSFTITHASSANTDQNFFYLVIGG